MIKAVCDRVIVKPIAEDTTSRLGITLETRTEKPQQGTVLSVWSDVKDLKEGNTVRFTRYAPDALDVDGEELFSLREGNILAYK